MEFQQLLLWLWLLPILFGVGAIAIYLLLKARHPPLPPLPPPSEFAWNASNLEMKGVRYPQSQGPPLVLVHGYAGNSRNWREMGYGLHRRGYDVWMPNLRGHGNGSHRSRVHHGESGNYSFTQIVTEDFPLIMQQVGTSNPRKLCLLAHSMGGIAARAYLSGIHLSPKGKIELNQMESVIRARQISGLILFGSPPHFHDMPTTLRWLMRQPAQLSEWLHSAIPIPGAKKSPTEPDPADLKNRVVKSMISKLSATLNRANPIKGVAHLENFNPKTNEFGRLIEKGISKLHVDLVRDMTRWVKSGEITSDDFDYSAAHPIGVPMLFIAGEFDQLAPPQSVFDLAKQYAKYTDVRTVLVKRTSHVDLISGERAERLLAPIVHDFAQDPTNLGPINSHLEIG